MFELKVKQQLFWFELKVFWFVLHVTLWKFEVPQKDWEES